MSGGIDLLTLYHLVNGRMSGSDFDLRPGDIPSKAIDDLFRTWLPGSDLKLTGATSPKLDAPHNRITLGGSGESFAINGTSVALTFTIAGQVPQLLAVATLNAGTGALSAAFPALQNSVFDGVDFGPSSTITLASWTSGAQQTGMSLSGMIVTDAGLAGIQPIFPGPLPVSAPITISSGGFPLFHGAAPPTGIQIGSLPLLTMTLVLDVSIPPGATQPVASITLVSSLPFTENGEQKTLDISAGVGELDQSILFRAPVDDTLDFGLSALSQLANAVDVRSLLPAQMSIPSVVQFGDWRMAISTIDASLTLLGISVVILDSWDIVPSVLELANPGLTLTVQPHSSPPVMAALTASFVIDPPDGGMIDVTAIYPGFVFSGSLAPGSTISLAPLLGRFIGASPSEFADVAIDTLAFSIDPTSPAYSLAAGINLGWTVSIGPVSFTFNDVAFAVAHTATQTTGSIAASVTFPNLANLTLDSSAAYDSIGDAWTFTTSLAPASSGFPLGTLIDTYAPVFKPFPLTNLTVDQFSITLQTGKAAFYHFLLGVTYEIDPGGGADPLLTASVTLNITHTPGAATPYSGVIAGTLSFLGIDPSFMVLLSDGASPRYQVTFFGVTESISNGILQITLPEGVSLGDIITTITGAALGEPVSLPSPFSVLNSIPLSGFVFKFDFTNKKTTVSYTTSGLDFGFMSIEEISLVYDGKSGSVSLNLVKGTFLGQNVQKTWDVTDPGSMASSVPGAGTSLIDVKFVGVGQRLGPVTPFSPSITVDEALTQFESLFATSPLSGGSLQFSDSNGWLLGADITFLSIVRLEAVFLDPLIYGVAITVNGANGMGKIFNGLAFEILYKRISDTVGVYQIDFTLPASVRSFDVGAVSVTLPSISVEIYTNGNFLIDLGFPYGGDFSGSFALQMLPFTGAGGFYFGVLSSATDRNLPQTTCGAFNPVIVFGLGLQVGWGKNISAGIMSAGLSLTVMAIVEGTVAFYHPYPGNPGDGDYYYLIEGQFGIAGHMYGEIDFAIISGRLDVTVTVSVTVQIARYAAMLLNFTAGVTVTVSVSINCGLFSISFDLSFSTTISESFTIGSDSTGPWDQCGTKKPFAPSFSRPLLRTRAVALDQPQCSGTVPMSWKRVLPGTGGRYAVPLLCVPQVTASSDIDGSGNPAPAKGEFVASFCIATTPPAANTPSPFDLLAEAVLLWAINAHINGVDTSVDTLKGQTITLEQLQDTYCGTRQTVDLEPFALSDLEQFASALFELTITVPPAPATSGPNASFIPVFPQMTLQAGTGAAIDFSTYHTATVQQLQAIKTYFKQLDAGGVAPAATTVSPAPQSYSMATFLFMDYFSGLARAVVQQAIDTMKNMIATTTGSDTLRGIAGAHPEYGFDVRELSRANLTRRLAAGITLSVSGRPHLVTDESHSTLLGVARHYGVDAIALAEENQDIPGLFTAGRRILLPAPAAITIGDLLGKMTYGDVAGQAARVFLAGLRPPFPTITDPPAGLYEITGQQFDASLLGAATKFTLSVDPGNLPWLAFGTPSQKSATLDVDTSDSMPITTGFDGITLAPAITGLGAAPLYVARPKQFTLANAIVWSDPDATQPVVPTIWSFPADLSQALDDSELAPPQVTLVEVVQDVPNRPSYSVAGAVPEAPHMWATTFEVTVRPSPDPANPTAFLPYRYELVGTSESDGVLLENLLRYSLATKPPPPVISGISILFAPDPKQSSPPNGLTSDPAATTSFFILQTNLSTVSNPAASGTFVLDAEAPPPPPAPPLQDPLTFVSLVWECSIVRSGGYVLYYRTTAPDRGLPSYLFEHDPQVTLTIVVQYNITSDVLHDFMSSVVISQNLVPKTTTLYIEATGDDSTLAPALVDRVTTIKAGNIAWQLQRTPPATPAYQGGTISPADAQAGLQQLFNLMSRSVSGTGFTPQPFSLPAGPAMQSQQPAGLDAPPPTGPPAVWPYSGVVPVAQFTPSPPPDSDPVPPAALDPYRAIGLTATLDFCWLDIFGNRIVTQNSGAANPFALDVPVLYFDPLIAIDQWPSTNIRFDVVSGAIDVYLTFDDTPYQSTKGNQLAASDAERYAAAYYQLNRDDVAITLAASIDVNAPPPTPAVRQQLVTYTAAATAHLLAIAAGTTPPPAPSATLSWTIADTNPEDIYELTVSVTIARTANVDPNFAKPPYSVASVTTQVRPRYSAPATKTLSSPPPPMTLQQFASNVESSFPKLKVLTGRKEPGGDSSRELWIARFDPAGGIGFSIDTSAWFIAIEPLANTPQSLSSVPIVPYVPGQFIGDGTAATESFANVDMELLMRDFLAAVDQFLSPQLGVPAWKALHDAGVAPNPVDDVLTQKRFLAGAIASRLAPVLNAQVHPGPSCPQLTAATEALTQRLLIALSDAYTIDTIVQYGVTATSQYIDDDRAPRLFGVPVVPAGMSASTNQYSLTNSRFSLRNGPAPTWLSFFFSAGNASQDATVTVPLHFKATHIELPQTEVVELGYTPSRWLTFVIPFGDASQPIDLGTPRIPVPLRTLPTPPTLVLQSATSDYKPDPPPPDPIAAAKLWTYAFEYEYAAADQDTIHVTATFNSDLTTDSASQATAFPRDAVLAALLQFSRAWPGVYTDLVTTLVKGSGDPKTVVQSFAWLVDQVAAAWRSTSSDLASLAAPLGPVYAATIHETAETVATNPGSLVAKLAASDEGTFVVPGFTIANFTTQPVDTPWAAGTASFAFSANQSYLAAAEGRTILARTIGWDGLDVLQIQNGAATIMIRRNETLDGLPTNPLFVYQSAQVAFTTVTVPLLDPPVKIVLTSGATQKQPLVNYLTSFLGSLFSTAGAVPFTARIGGSFVYDIAGGTGGDPLQASLPVTLPIFLTLPLDPQDPAIPATLAGAVESFVAANALASRRALVQISVSLFSGLSSAQLPILTLDSVLLDTLRIAWPA